MKTKTICTLGTTLFVVFILAGIAAAWSGKDVTIGLPLLILLFDLVEELAGVAAVIGAGIIAHEYKHMLPSANLVAGVGGAWSANRCFGWP